MKNIFDRIKSITTSDVLLLLMVSMVVGFIWIGVRWTGSDIQTRDIKIQNQLLRDSCSDLLERIAERDERIVKRTEIIDSLGAKVTRAEQKAGSMESKYRKQKQQNEQTIRDRGRLTIDERVNFFANQISGKDTI